MSNPTLAVADLQSDLVIETPAGATAFTGVDPIRFVDGLWVEEAATNYVVNPVGAVATTSWPAISSVTLDRVDALPGPLPDWFADVVTTGFKLTLTGTKSANTILAIGIANLAASVAHQTMVYAWIPSAVTATGLSVGAANFGAPTEQTDGVVDLSKRDQWQFVTGSLTPAADIVGHWALRLTAGSMASGQELWITCAAIQPGTYPTSPVAEVMGDGYANVGTEHNSPSTRAASSASLDPTGILDSASGAIAFRVTPTIETGLEEIWGECGVKGAGTDHLRWGRDASTHPFVEWSSNDAAYQRLTASETLAAGTAYDLYFGHTGTVTSLAVDAGTLQTGTRAAVSGDFSTGDLTLEASAGGVIYQPFATFNRTLTAKEIATLNGKNNWTMKVLAGNPYINFQLRPY